MPEAAKELLKPSLALSKRWIVGAQLGPPNGWAFSGEPSERSERPERMRGRRVRCNAMLGAVRHMARAVEEAF
jgi:hypothetical protein